MVDIKDIQGNIILSTPINEGSKRKFTLQKEDYVTLKFSLDDPIYFKLGNWVDTDFGLFELVDLYKPNYNQSTAGYDYELRLDAYYWKWKNKKLKYSPESAAKETSFNLTATLDVHAGIVLRNLSALGYKYRGVDFTFSIDSTVENKPFLMTYDNINILDACFQMANSAGCECWVTDNIIHFGRCEFGDPVDFELGVNVDTMKRSDSQTEYSTRIIAFGSTRNIPTNYRPTDDSMIVARVVQKRLMLPVGTSYVDAYENMAEEEAVEDVVVFDDVYPRRIGTMSGVTTKQYIDKIENADGTTTSEVWNAYRFKDSINFSKDYVISGQDLKIKFESGLLNGMEFGVTFNPDGKPEKINGDWNPEAQIWEIVRNSDYGVNLPNDTLKPVNGDKFVLSGFDITFVSDTYIPLAEQELLQKAQEYVAKTKIDPSTYDNKMMSGGTLYEVGDRVNLINPGYFENGRVSRIIGFEYNLDIPTDSPIYTVGETAAYSRIGDIEEKLETITYKSQTYTGSGGSGVYVIRLNDSTTASNSNVFSSLRQLAMFLRKDIPDKASEIIDFLKGLTVNGDKASIDKDGIATVQELIALVKAQLAALEVTGNAKAKTATITHKVTTLNLLVQKLAETYDLNVSNVATLFRTIIRDYVSSETFIHGLTGEGFKLYKALNGDWNLELDNLTIRKAMTIFELIISKVRAVNGGLVVSPANGRVKSVSEDLTSYVLGIEGDMTFVADDLVRCQVFSPSGAKYYWVRIVSVSGDAITIPKSEFPIGVVPAVGDDLVQMGNKTNTARQGVLYLTASEDGKPRFSVLDGVNSTDLTGKNKLILGCLDGITDSDFPSDAQPSGYGLWAVNVFLKGLFILRNGKSVEDELNDQITAVQTAFEIREGQISSKVTQATTAATQASGYAASASGSASTATTKATEASNSANAAAGSATAAQDAADDAATVLSQVTTKESSINQTASNITLQVSEVTTKVATATSKASEAATSASNAKTSETNASGSASTASSKATAAATSATNAANSATAAAGSATTAANILTEVTEKKSSIDQTADSITLKVSEVNTKTAQAVTSATNAANSATTASTAAGTATTKATEAANSASTATTKATAASGSASAAATSATNAATSAANAANILTSVTTKQSEINQTAGNITLQVTEVTTKTVQATNAAELAMAMSKGKMLYRDPTFVSGFNGVSLYNNLGNGMVTHNRVSGISGNPNGSGYCLKITTTGAASPGWGGFTFVTGTKANQVLVVRFVANIPSGYTVDFATNPTGDGGSRYWLTNHIGTGKWEEYSYKVICGSTGSFSTTNFFYLSGGSTPTASAPLIWYVCYATVFDVTDVDDVPTRSEASSDAQTKANTAESNAKSYANSTFTTKTEFSSQLSVLNNSISSKVSQTDFNSLNTRVSSAEQKITPDAIILTVSSTITTAKNEAINAAATDATTKANNAKSGAVSEIVSSFNITSGGITIGSKTIALTGLITFSSLASDAQTKITSAQSTANQALGSISNLSADIGAMAYYDNVSLAKLDSTIVEGGYIKTSLIDANAIITGSLLAAKIAATDITTNRLTIGAGARIGDLYIYDGGLNTNQQGLIAMGENYMGLSRSALSLFYNNYGTQGAGWSRYLSTRVAPGSLSVKCVTSNSNFTDPGLQIEVSGNSDNTAINILAGHISGFRLKMRTVTTSQTLSVADGIIISEADSEITLTLPSSPGNGKMYFIRKNGGGRIWISGSYIINDGDWYRERSTRVQLNRGGLGILMFNGTYWTWNNMNG